MHASTLLTLLAAAGTSTAFALPPGYSIVTRQDEQKYENPDGNTRVALTTDAINWGDAPPWNVLDGIKGHCTTVGCEGSDKLEVDTRVQYKASDGYLRAETRKISVSVTGTFAATGPGSRDDLVELAKMVFGNSQYEVKQETYTDDPACVPSPIPCPVAEAKKIDQYYHQSGVDIQYLDGDSDVRAFMNIRIEVDSGSGDSRTCGVDSNVVEIGGVIAGAFNGYAGAAFSLFEFFCGAL
ncbi:hypothetical protein CkaCkLH20_02073 [Colletotrichum karsti]|uniref:Uncharacterized protein n=1 Tax=Colletotrichum karsti TaxID=1095194 RepID=A0A9P6ICT7_9PEZI|nr:uncharacterized protein CkaCkLH20_02073 [Colletotrichum karsti]KAF9880119.1 hypothetical protein CkaCkLH20_02073 [Colletotrichum karsti]